MNMQKMMNEMNKVKAQDPSKNIVIAYGSAKMASGGKGEISIPVDRAFTEWKKHFITIPVGEFRTTVVSNTDDVSYKM